MLFFRGLHHVNLDQKGRLAIPKRLRETIAQAGCKTLVATIDLQSPCLLLYPFEEWKLIEQKIMSLPNLDPTARRYQRLFVGFAHELDMDGQGRILLPAVLRQHIDLERQGVLLGQGNKWSCGPKPSGIRPARLCWKKQKMSLCLRRWQI